MSYLENRLYNSSFHMQGIVNDRPARLGHFRIFKQEKGMIVMFAATEHGQSVYCLMTPSEAVCILFPRSKRYRRLQSRKWTVLD